jgi:lysophospholipase L1-like esterase
LLQVATRDTALPRMQLFKPSSAATNLVIGGDSLTRNRPQRKKLSFGRKLLFSCVLGVFFLLAAVCGVLVLDLYLHHKFANATVNYRGYRGAIAGPKQPNELRLVVLGGSTAFGYGLPPEEAFPALLEKRLRAQTGRPVKVINLAYNNQGAYSFLPTLKDYEYLQYDGIILYEGYNDLQPNTAVFRRDSPVFTTFGYYPIFPIVFAEKLKALHYGPAGQASRGEKTVFKPTLADRAKAGALEGALKVTSSLNHQLRETASTAGVHSPYCSDKFAFYCNNVGAALDYAVAHHKPAIVAGQPYIAPLHREQQRELASMIEKKYPDSAIVRYVNLGDAVDLHNPALAYDGMHLLPAGNQIIAGRLAGPVLSAFPPQGSPAK